MQQPYPLPPRINPAGQSNMANDWARALVATVAATMPIGGTRFYRFPPLTALLTAGATSNPQTIRFMSDGIVTVCQGSIASGLAVDAGNTGFRIQISGQEELFTDGFGAQFMQYATAFGTGGPNAFPIYRRVYSGQQWSVLYQNTGLVDVKPDLGVWLLEDQPQKQ